LFLLTASIILYRTPLTITILNIIQQTAMFLTIIFTLDSSKPTSTFRIHQCNIFILLTPILILLSLLLFPLDHIQIHTIMVHFEHLIHHTFIPFLTIQLWEFPKHSIKSTLVARIIKQFIKWIFLMVLVYFAPIVLFLTTISILNRTWFSKKLIKLVLYELVHL